MNLLQRAGDFAKYQVTAQHPNNTIVTAQVTVPIQSFNSDSGIATVTETITSSQGHGTGATTMNDQDFSSIMEMGPMMNWSPDSSISASGNVVQCCHVKNDGSNVLLGNAPFGFVKAGSTDSLTCHITTVLLIDFRFAGEQKNCVRTK